MVGPWISVSSIRDAARVGGLEIAHQVYICFVDIDIPRTILLKGSVRDYE